MKSSKENRKFILEYIESQNRRVRKSELERQFVTNSLSPNRMSKKALYRTLDYLVAEGKILIKEEGRKVYYEALGSQQADMIRRFIERFKRNNQNLNPTITEIAIYTGLTPLQVEESVYKIAKTVGWSPQNETIRDADNIYSSSREVVKADNEELTLILGNLAFPESTEVAAKFLLKLVYYKNIIWYPKLCQELTSIFKKQELSASWTLLLHALETIINSRSFEAKLKNEKFRKEFDKLLDTLYDIACNTHLDAQKRGSALHVLFLANYHRVFDLINQEFKTLKIRDSMVSYFDNWMAEKFYTANKITLMRMSFEISKKNKFGADLLEEIINKRW